jgi:hypothetical protein
MSAMSDSLETSLLNHIFKNSAYSMPAATYIALGTAAFGDTNVTANEVSTANWPAYVRQQVTIGSGWTGPSGGQVANAGAVTFPANNGAGNVVVTDIGIYDASSGGNLLFHATLPQAKTLAPADVISFAVGAITVALQ